MNEYEFGPVLASAAAIMRRLGRYRSMPSGVSGAKPNFPSIRALNSLRGRFEMN